MTMHSNDSLPCSRSRWVRLARKTRSPRRSKGSTFERLERRYTPAYPASMPNFDRAGGTFTLDRSFVIDPAHPWAQLDISYSSSGDVADQLVIDGNGKTVEIKDPNFAGLFFAGNTLVGTAKPTILKNFTLIASVDISTALAKITGAVHIVNCHLQLNGNINANGGGLAYNDGSDASGLRVSVTNSSASVFGKIGDNAGPLIGYIAANSGNVYDISNSSTVVSDSDSLAGNTLGSGAGAFVGSGVSNTVNIASSYALFNGSMSNGSGIIAGKFLASSGTLTIDKFYAVTNITAAPSSPTDPSQNAYGLSSYFGGFPANTFNLSHVNVLNYGRSPQYVSSVGGSGVASLAGYGDFSTYAAFAAAANAPTARIGDDPYSIHVTSGGGDSTDTFYTFAPLNGKSDWALNLVDDTLIGVPEVIGLDPREGPVAGGNQVRIVGRNLTNATSVVFGSTPAVSFTVQTPNRIMAIAPAGTLTTVDVQVATAGGISANTSNDDYNYVASTTTALSSSANPSAFGQSVTFTATVTASAGTATGTVTFRNGPDVLGTSTLDGNGQATLSTAALAIGGPYSITATFDWSPYFTASMSDAVSQTVTPFGVASQVSVTTPAGGIVNGSAFATQPVVLFRDAFGNTVTDSTAAVTMTVSAGASTVGTTTVNAVNGVAAFTNAGIGGAGGTQYTLTFATPNLTPATQNVTLPSTTFTVTSLADDGASGTLRWAITQANGLAGPDAIVFTPSLGGMITLVSSLPAITQPVAITGPGRSVITISGAGRVADGFRFESGSAGSELRDLSLRGFRRVGIRLESTPGVTISNVGVTGMNTGTSTGLYASGDLAGATIESSLFTGCRRGAVLDSVRHLTFGAIGRGNQFSNNRSLPGTNAFGTGIRAEGDLTGTVVAGNTFDRNNRGVAFVNARNLRVEQNLFTRNRVAVVFVEGDNSGSSMAGNTFGTGALRNARIFQRVRGSQGI
jgi:hypothetical protein